MDSFLVDLFLILHDVDVKGVVEVLQQDEVYLVQVEKGGAEWVYFWSIVQGAEETSHIESI
jgi:hypothetical protein